MDRKTLVEMTSFRALNQRKWKEKRPQMALRKKTFQLATPATKLINIWSVSWKYNIGVIKCRSSCLRLRMFCSSKNLPKFVLNFLIARSIQLIYISNGWLSTKYLDKWLKPNTNKELFTRSNDEFRIYFTNQKKSFCLKFGYPKKSTNILKSLPTFF